MKINPKILSIPPYISTSWKNIASLHVEDQQSILVLVVTLLSGVRIEVPHLEQVMIEGIFTAHARYLEQEEKAPPRAPTRLPLSFPGGQEQILSLGLPIKNSIVGMDNLGNLLQHNPEQADSPDLPNDVLQKIAQLSKTMGIDDPNAVPKPEPHCNCMHCQIARALQNGCTHMETVKEEPEEIVTDEDLKFKTWDIQQTGEKLYKVSNPLDDKEHYNVYLGDPVGCTCGENHCEHIRAVLNT
jgi:hypothetical protein